MPTPTIRKPLTDDFANIVGAKEFKAKQASDISGLKVQLADHVEISLVAPSNSFLVNVATAIIMPRHVLQNVAPADFPKHPFARQPIYTGPFKVDEWKSGESITYSAFTDHFKGRPKLDKVVQRIFPDPTTAVTELRSGGIQQAFIANPDQFGEFQTNSNYSTQQLAGTLGWFFSWDMTNPTFPFAEKDFRVAVSRAIDRKTLVDALFRGLAEPGHSLASPLSWIYNPNIPTYDYDPAPVSAVARWAGLDGRVRRHSCEKRPAVGVRHDGHLHHQGLVPGDAAHAASGRHRHQQS